MSVREIEREIRSALSKYGSPEVYRGRGKLEFVGKDDRKFLHFTVKFRGDSEWPVEVRGVLMGPKRDVRRAIKALKRRECLVSGPNEWRGQYKSQAEFYCTFHGEDIPRFVRSLTKAF